MSQESCVLNNPRLDSLAYLGLLNSHSHENVDKEGTFLKFTFFVNLSEIFVLVLESPSRWAIDFGINFYFLMLHPFIVLLSDRPPRKKSGAIFVKRSGRMFELCDTPGKLNISFLESLNLFDYIVVFKSFYFTIRLSTRFSPTLYLKG